MALYNLTMNTNYFAVKAALQNNASLCIVSKYRTTEQILSYYEAGERLFAENRVSELKEKAAVLPKDIEWHLIGHLQKNKVRDAVRYAKCIQSVDSYALAEYIEKECIRQNKTMRILAEFHLAEEDANKTGMRYEDAFAFFDACKKLPHVHLCGIMVMGPHTEDTKRIQAVFTKAHELFVSLQERYGSTQITTLSMGMSSDYPIALACGSTMVRLGTCLFE